MGAYIFPTDTMWAEFLRHRPDLDEVNFWLPSERPFRALHAGDRFLFRSKATAGGRLIGGGLFDGYVKMRSSEAWAIYGEGNGCSTFNELLARLNSYRTRNGTAAEFDPVIGCILLHDTFFVPPSGELPLPANYSTTAVRGRGYADADPQYSYVEEAFAQMLVDANVPELHPDSDAITLIPGPTHGQPRLMIPRVGQKGFKSLILDSYHRRCSITGAKIVPTLQAAHIRPISLGGEHRVDNGLLLRSDVHILFDAGYLGVDDHHRLHVSPRLRSDFGNGDEFYARSGEIIDLPDRRADRPDKEALTWHMDTLFQAS